jgi:membrane protease YdiL (CAAX protease family)
MRHFVERYPMSVYLFAAYVFSWSFWSFLILTTPPDVMQKGPPPTFFLFAALGGIGPSLAGIATTAIIDGSLRELFSGFRWSRAGSKWYTAALLVSPFLGLMTLAVERTFGLPTATLEEMIETWPLCLIFPFFSASGEEVGWRGFLLPRLQKRHSAFKSSILVGVAWGMWHIPTQILGMRQYGPMVVLASIFVSHIVAMTAQSVVATWLYNNSSSQSLLTVVLYHYSLTFTAIFMSPLTSSDSAMLPHWLIFAVLYWVAALIIIVTSGSEHLVRKPFKTRQA